MKPPKIMVSMPYHGCPQTIRRAVESVLGQTHSELILVVVNDGSPPDAAWKPLEGVTDPRLIRFNLSRNQGRFYADAVTLAACNTGLYAIHDADDWAEPEWLAELVDEFRRHGDAGCVVAPQIVHHSRYAAGVVEPLHPSTTSGKRLHRFSQLAHHATLYRTDALRSVGGPHPGYYCGYDTLMVNAVRLRHPILASETPRYHRVRRAGSLTTSPTTRLGSPARRRVGQKLAALYGKMINLDESENLRDFIWSTVPDNIAHSVATDANRLSNIIRYARV